MGIIEDISISQIASPIHNPRSDVDQIDELVNSIRQKGLLQPIITRPKAEGCFEVVAGHRRYLSCKRLGWKKIPSHIMELDDKEAFEIALVENVQRKTLSLLDESRSYKAYVTDFGWGGVSDLAIKLGKSISYITRKIQLLDLPSDVLDSISKSDISSSVAQELISVKDKKIQSTLASMITNRHLSFRQTRELLKNAEFNEMGTPFQKSDAEIRSLKASRRLDKTIIALRLAMNTLGTIIEDAEDDHAIHKILMHHKNLVHEQIDMLIKEKIKLRRNRKI